MLGGGLYGAIRHAKSGLGFPKLRREHVDIHVGDDLAGGDVIAFIHQLVNDAARELRGHIDLRRLDAPVASGEALGKIGPRKLPPGEEASAGAEEYDCRRDKPFLELLGSLGTGSATPGRGRRAGGRNTLRGLLLDGRLLEGLRLWLLRLGAHVRLPFLLAPRPSPTVRRGGSFPSGSSWIGRPLLHKGIFYSMEEGKSSLLIPSSWAAML